MGVVQKVTLAVCVTSVLRVMRATHVNQGALVDRLDSSVTQRAASHWPQIRIPDSAHASNILMDQRAVHVSQTLSIHQSPTLLDVFHASVWESVRRAPALPPAELR